MSCKSSGSLGASGSSDVLQSTLRTRVGAALAPASVPPMPGLAATSPSGSSASSGSAPSSAVAPRRGKGAAQGAQQQPPRCQVDLLLQTQGLRRALQVPQGDRHRPGAEVQPTVQQSRTADLPPPCIVTHMANLDTEAAECPTRQPWTSDLPPPCIVTRMANLDTEAAECPTRQPSFHQLSEFDQGNRSCRRRLAGHNERRRKPPPGSLSSRYGRVPSTLHEDSNRFGGFVLDFSHSRISSNARDE
ncbi:hypothetical protein Taro_012894 [Colocasia esculenta]|uniref:SBP-type domain-containing protein n=1 Tax=Colocasia esculenta TaxID=4460 RepID=A0A843UEB9_COLES|nr:hypothetical protein [Colocasia esculenta]